MKPSLVMLACCALALVTCGCALVRPLPDMQGIRDRLAAMPTHGAPIHAPVEIHFNDQAVPFIHCQDDRDAPFAMGLVQAHLRLGQLEMFRLLAQGRASEALGPWAKDLDHTLRLLDVTRAVPGIEAGLDPETRQWLTRFAQGLDFYKRNTPDLPHEVGLFGVQDQGWTLDDVLAIQRMASVDVNWLFWSSMLRHYDEPARAELWQRLVAQGMASSPSFDPQGPVPWEAQLSALKAGSNALAVSGARSASGAGLLACDAHVGLNLPPLWLLMGVESPNYAATGLTLPGVPAILVGRNRVAAWGGTNMISLSSSLYDVSDLPEDQFTYRSEHIGVRWFNDADVTLRESPFGPVITDSPHLRGHGLPDLALTWRGHEPSFEVAAMLRANRATSFEEFRRAFADWAVSGQYFLYADQQGTIGMFPAMAYDPAAGRTVQGLAGDPNQEAQRWGREFTTLDMPFALNPAQGFLVSANNLAFASDPPLSVAGLSNDRAQRMRQVLEEHEVADRDLLAALQTDTYSQTSHELAQALCALAGDAAQAEPRAGQLPETRALLQALAQWDGRYDIDSRGAAALELVAYHLAKDLYTERYGEELCDYLLSSAAVYAFLLQDLAGQGGQARQRLDQALAQAAPDLARHSTWGELHRLELRHTLGGLPLVGRELRYGDVPWPGSSNTLYKSAHELAPGPQEARYGANARFLADLADPDGAWAALLGGQDGFLNSRNFLDLLEPWQHGEYMRLPLNLETVRREYTHCIRLEPGDPQDMR